MYSQDTIQHVKVFLSSSNVKMCESEGEQHEGKKRKDSLYV